MTSTNSKPRRQFKLTEASLGVWSVIVFIFLFAPIIVIFVYSFNSGRLLAAWDGFGFDGYQAMLEKTAVTSSVWVSLRAGVFSALLATLLGTLAGVAMARRPGKWVAWFSVLLLLWQLPLK